MGLATLQERTGMVPPLVDVTAALSPADAFRMLESQLNGWQQNPPGGQALVMNAAVAVDCGALVLTPKLLQKMVVILRQYQCTLGMVYARLPQTQQAALGMGLLVKEVPDIADFEPAYAPQPEPVLELMTETVHPFGGGQSLSERPQAPVMTAPVVSTELLAAMGPAIEPVQPTLDAQYTVLPTEELSFEPVMAAPAPVATEAIVSTSVQPDVAASPTVAPPVIPEATPSTFETVTLPISTPMEMPERPVSTISPELVAADTLPTRLVMGSLRSGRTLASDGHLIVVGDVHNGSEIIAAGHIVVWGELRGVAHAGAWLAADTTETPEQPYAPCLGESGTIRALAIHAVQLRIGRLIARRPDRVHNHKPERQTSRGQAATAMTPEIARVVDREIRIYEALD